MQSFITHRKISKRLLSVVFLTFSSMVFCFTSVQAQTTITTSPPYPITSASAEVTFNFTNNNTLAVALTSLSSVVNLPTGNADVFGFYKPGAIAGPPGIINAANGWIQFATATVTATGTGTPQPFFTSNLLIPAGATYGIAIRSYATGTTTAAIAYSNAPTPATFTAGGCTFTSGANVGFAGPAAGAAPTFTPRGFTGSITFGIPCSGTPNPGNTLASQQAVCSGTPVTFTPLNTIIGTGVTYQWETSTLATGPWTNAPGASTAASYATTITATAFYRVKVTCAGNTGISTEIKVTSTACTCLTPDVATICENTIQKLSVTIPPGTVQTFSSAASIAIPSVGIATPYPSTIAVSGVAAGSTVKSVTLNGVTHTFPNDIDVALTSPTSISQTIMSDVGGGAPGITSRVYTFDDAAPTAMTIATTPAGTYKPSNVGASDNFPAPGPGATFSNATPLLSNFTGNMNGNWNLYVIDDAGGDQGSINGYSITFASPLPTAIWTGGTFFTDPAATIAYVPGTPATVVYVRPSTTTTYTATIASGPCAGANTVTVTVLPRPVVSVSPLTSCASTTNTLTATGAVTYAWSPTTGLNSTSTASVIANPATTTSYTVLGTATNGCQTTSAPVTVNATPTAAVVSLVPPAIFQIQEGFTSVLPAGWARQNLSNPLGAQNWGQGITTVFNSFNGAPTAYAHNNFNSTTGDNTISSWMFTPVVNIKNGDVISFYTRTQDPAANGGLTFPDRLELRMSTNGASVNAGTTNVSVGDYTNLLLTVNPTLTTTGYPFTWTQYTATVSGITGTVSGRFAFRYFVTNGGTTGANSDNIGVDQVEYSTPVPFICPSTTSNLKVDITGGVGPFTLVYNNGSTNTTFSNYVSGTNIQVSPTTTTTYTVVSVTGANGCQLPTAGSAYTLNVTQPTTITTQPTGVSTVCGSNATFTVATAGGAPNPITWEVRTSPTAPFTTVVAGPQYTGVGTTSLTVVNVNPSVNGYQYRVRLQGPCSAENISNVATLTVTPIVAVVTPPTPAICLGAVQQLSIANISSPVPGSVVVNSPTLNLNVLDNNPAGVNNSITIPPLPAGAIVTGARVRLNVASTWVGDLNVNLKAPSNQILNLSHNLSTTNGNANGGGSFVNTVIGSAFTTPLHTPASPDNTHTGNYKADAGTTTVNGITPNITGFVPTTALWTPLLSTPSGTWTIAIADIFGGADVTTFQNWSLTIDYLLGSPSTGVFTGPTGTMFTNAAATTPYTSTAVNTIYVKPTMVGVNNYSVVVTDGACASLPLTIPVTVNTAATGTIVVANVTTCLGTNATFSFSGLTAGTGLSYQWQVSTSATPAFTDITGATATTYAITGVTAAMSGDKYRMVIKTNGCTPTNDLISAAATLTVNPTPTVVISAAPVRNLFPGLTSTLTAAVSPAPTGATYQWFRNGVAVAGATNNRFVVGIDGLGTYTVRVVDGNGCITNTSTITPPVNVVIADSATSNTLFVYPVPNNGNFQVRYFNEGKAPAVVNVFDSKGALVFTQPFSVSQAYQAMNVNLGIHGKGVYRIDVLSSNGNRIKTTSVVVF